MRRLLNALLHPLGYDLRRHRPGEPAATMAGALARGAARAPGIRTVIDVGASTGRWSRQAQEAFPAARYLLVEANPVHRERLEAFRRADPRVDFLLAAAGDAPGEIFFDPSDPSGGTASHAALDPRYVRVPCTTLDAAVREKGLAGPYLVKLDTHGFEVPILDGAAAVLAETDLLVVEAYNFRLPPREALRFPALCALLEGRGFRPIDLCDPLWRPGDGALWQLDLVFARSSRPEFARDTYA